MKIVRIEPGHWEIYKNLRLNALKLAPDMFGSKYADAVKISDTEWRERVGKFSSDSKTVNFIAFLNEKPVGMVSCYIQEKPLMVQMWVEPEARGQKVGEALIKALKVWVAAAGEKTLECSVMGHNSAAIKLYKSLGFEETREPADSGCEIHLRCRL